MAQPQLEDTWAFVPIGHPFPDNPFRVKGDTNQFVALWYKHGKPTCGRAWNNGGVLECSFPYKGSELTGAKDLGGEIQVLTFTGNFKTRKFLYNWIPYKDRHEPHYQLVRCGGVIPALIKTKDGEMRMGQIDMNSGIASASYTGKAEDQTNIQELQIIVRNLKEPPPTKPPPPPPRPLPPCPHELGQCPPLGEDGWVDLRVKSHKFPRCSVKALGRPLKLEDGSKQEQAVCLWYKHGEPVMGRAYDVGCLAATFGWEGKEFSGDVGSLPVLCYHSKEEQGFEITWRPFKRIRTAGWAPIQRQGLRPLRH
ncbi:MAG: hypothetical protein GY696_07245, partial [Gammaproteobacteria bacterium]|nr:hypothetical protein [Gammaproteobacteria bacterium]